MLTDFHIGRITYRMLFNGDTTLQAAWHQLHSEEMEPGIQVTRFPGPRILKIESGIAVIENEIDEVKLSEGQVLYVPSMGRAVIRNADRSPLRIFVTMGEPSDTARVLQDLYQCDQTSRAKLWETAQAHACEVYVPDPEPKRPSALERAAGRIPTQTIFNL